jgi:serine/threonine protein phosphatase 1
MRRVFVIGDIHGAFRALRQCLQRSEFDYENDQLICLGDVSDGWPETKASIDELLRVKNLIYILGNHDWWTLQWMLTGKVESVWYNQGGKATIESYGDSFPASHLVFLSEAVLYHLHENKLFVHAGIDPQRPLEQQDQSIFLWDRSLARLALDAYQNRLSSYQTAWNRNAGAFDEIYIGHTPIPYERPVGFSGIWLMDTGAGWEGVLSIMNVDSKATFISEPVPSLYPGIEGRKRNL